MAYLQYQQPLESLFFRYAQHIALPQTQTRRNLVHPVSHQPEIVRQAAITAATAAASGQGENAFNFRQPVKQEPSPHMPPTSAPTSQQHTQSPEPDPVYINDKQFGRILIRRKARERFPTSKERKPYLHESRHNHVMRRPRRPDGRFLTADEVKEKKEDSTEGDAPQETLAEISTGGSGGKRKGNTIDSRSITRARQKLPAAGCFYRDIVTMPTHTNNTPNTRVSKLKYIQEAKEICTPVCFLLPASAAFAPRTSTHIVLGSKVDPWLSSILKPITKLRLGNSVQNHKSCLTETLSSSSAIWTLASITLPKAPDAELKDSIPLTEAFQLMHIEAYVMFIDMVLRNEVAFKLTSNSIKSLIEYHRGIHCVNLANTRTYSELEIEKLQENFLQAIQKFVYRTHVHALEGLELDGSGELLCEKSEEVKTNILSLLQQAPPQKILPPPHQKPPLLQKLRPLLSKNGVPPELVLGSSIGSFPMEEL